MGYGTVHDKLHAHWKELRENFNSGKPSKWFTDQFSSLSEMSVACNSDEENASVAAGYKEDKYDKKRNDNAKLAYVCAVRREIRRQYASGESDPFTDVTPYRYADAGRGMALLFEDLLDFVVKKNNG